MELQKLILGIVVILILVVLGFVLYKQKDTILNTLQMFEEGSGDNSGPVEEPPQEEEPSISYEPPSVKKAVGGVSPLASQTDKYM